MTYSAAKVANLVSEISQASQEYSNGISQVNIAITNPNIYIHSTL